MPNKQPPATSSRRNIDAVRGSSARWAAASGVVALAVAGGYLGLYRAKGFRLPVGFDAPWYIWRASFLAAHGMGPVGTSTRPGSAVLAAVLGSLTGRSQFTMAVLLGPVLAGVFALTVGALAWSSMGPERVRWVAAVVVGGAVLGATRLVDENVATLLFLCLVVSALVPLVAAAAGRGPRWAFVGSVVLLVAAGLAHWLFLAVFGVVLAGAVVLLVPRSLRQRSEGVSAAQTEAGTLASAGVATAGVMAVAVFGLLRAPANTIQLKEDPGRFVPKLTNDASRLRLWLLGPAAALGAWVSWVSWPSLAGERSRSRRRSVILAVMIAWSAVALGGVAFGVLTKRLPPHRFLELLVVVPGVVALAEAVSWLAARARQRMGSGAGWAVAAGVALLLAVPGLSAWYASGAPRPWIDRLAMFQLSAAARWSETVAPGTPFVVLVTPQGTAGTESPALKERTVRAAMPADRQEQLHVFVGTFADLLARRQPRTPNPAMNAAILPYWRDVEPLLASRPPIVIVQALAPTEVVPAAEHGAGRIGNGVRLFQARFPGDHSLGFPPILGIDPPNAFPGVAGAAFWTAVIMGVLWVVGFGWTRTVSGPGAPASVSVGLSPAVGAGALVVVGTLASRAGVALNGGAAWLLLTLTATAGFVAARLTFRNGKATLPSDVPVDSPDG